MALCNACSSISLHSLRERLPSRVSWHSETARQENGELGVVHLQNAVQIVELAKKCPLCALIQESLFEDLKANRLDGAESPQLELSEDPLILTPKVNLRGCPFPDLPVAGFHLTGFNTNAAIRTKGGNHKLLFGRVRLHVDGKSSGCVVVDSVTWLTCRQVSKRVAIAMLSVDPTYPIMGAMRHSRSSNDGLKAVELSMKSAKRGYQALS